MKTLGRRLPENPMTMQKCTSGSNSGCSSWYRPESLTKTPLDKPGGEGTRVNLGQEQLWGCQENLLSPPGCPWQARGNHPKERKWQKKGWSREQKEKEVRGKRLILIKKKEEESKNNCKYPQHARCQAHCLCPLQVSRRGAPPNLPRLLAHPFSESLLVG